ncbi:MAG: hypothetical protein ACM31L_00340 [Actinomycetota bacterium]
MAEKSKVEKFIDDYFDRHLPGVVHHKKTGLRKGKKTRPKTHGTTPKLKK